MSVKVCHITSAHQPYDVRIFYKECSSLSKAGYEVVFLHPGKLCEIKNGVSIIGLSIEIKNRFQRITKVVNALFEKAIEIDSDIYQLHDPELIRLGQRLLLRGKKVIYDAHEDLPRQISGKDWIPSLLKKTIASIAERTENRFVRKASAVIAATPFIAERFKKINRNTVEVNNFPLIEEFIENNSFRIKENEICYIGSISRIRGIYELVVALDKTNVTLNLAGNFETTQIENDLKNLTGWKKVNYFGYVDRKKINEILCRSSIGIVTLYPQINYLDSLPIKMFEYMAAGIPVLASDFPYWKEILDRNNCGVTVNPKNTDDLSSAINLLMNNTKQMNEMGYNGRKAITEKYNWEKESLKMINLYKSL